MYLCICWTSNTALHPNHPLKICGIWAKSVVFEHRSKYVRIWLNIPKQAGEVIQAIIKIISTILTFFVSAYFCHCVMCICFCICIFNLYFLYFSSYANCWTSSHEHRLRLENFIGWWQQFFIQRIFTHRIRIWAYLRKHTAQRHSDTSPLLFDSDLENTTFLKREIEWMERDERQCWIDLVYSTGNSFPSTNVKKDEKYLCGQMSWFMESGSPKWASRINVYFVSVEVRQMIARWSILVAARLLVILEGWPRRRKWYEIQIFRGSI